MSDKILEINDLYVKYKSGNKDVKAVNGISFTLTKGKTFGLVGETGAGKTTTALSIMNLLPTRTGVIEKGDIKFMDKDIFSLDEKKLRTIRGDEIAMIFQDPMTSLNPVFTIREQLAETVKMHYTLTDDEINEKVVDVLNMVGINENRVDNYPHEFSGGMKQRVIIAMALINNPKLLIADEPTTALDVTIQAQVLDLMRNLRDELDTSMILITHDLGVVAEMCDEVGIMYAGEIVEYGNLRDVYKGDMHHPYTKGLFASIPDINSAAKRLSPIQGMVPDPTSLGKGCFFCDRCPDAMPICRLEHPKYYVKGSHRILCHLYKNEEA